MSRIPRKRTTVESDDDTRLVELEMEIKRLQKILKSRQSVSKSNQFSILNSVRNSISGMECQISEIIQVCFNVINDMQTLSDRVEYLLQDDTICLEETTIAHNITSSSSLALIDDHVLKPSDSLMSNMRPTKIPRTTRSQMSSNHTKNLQKIQTIEDIEQIRNENKANNTQTTMTDELFNSTFVKSSSNLKSKKEKPKNDISVFDFDPNSPDLETSDTRFRFFKSRSRPNGTNTRANTNKPDIQKKPTNTPKPKLKANVRKKKDTTSPIVRNLRSRACKKK